MCARCMATTTAWSLMLRIDALASTARLHACSSPRQNTWSIVLPRSCWRTPTGGRATAARSGTSTKPARTQNLCISAHSPRSAAAADADAAGRGGRSLLELSVPTASNAREVHGFLQGPRLQDVVGVLDLCGAGGGGGSTRRQSSPRCPTASCRRQHSSNRHNML